MQFAKLTKRVHRYAKSHPKKAFLLLLAAITALCIIASVLIDTDREKVSRAISQSRKALQRGDADAAMRLVAPDFQQEGWGRAQLGLFIAAGLRSFGPPKISILSENIEMEDQTATCILDVVAAFPQFRGVWGTLTRGRWRVSLEKKDRTWYITELTPLSVEGRQGGGLRGLNDRYINQVFGAD